MANTINREVLARQVLAEMMFFGGDCPQIIDRALSVITAEMMPTPRTREVFQSIHRQHSAGRRVDMVTVLADTGLQPTALALMGAGHIAGCNFDWHLFMLFEFHYAMRLYRLLREFKGHPTAREILKALVEEPSKLDATEEALEYLIEVRPASQNFGQYGKALERELVKLREEVNASIGRVKLLGFYSQPKPSYTT